MSDTDWSSAEATLIAVSRYGDSLFFAESTLKAQKAVVLAAVNQCGSALRFADAALKSDRDVALAAIAQSGEALQFVDPELFTDRGFVLAAIVAQNGAGATRVMHSSKGGGLVEPADQSVLCFVDASFKDDKEVILAAVHQHGHLLRFASAGLTMDKDIAMAAIAQDSSAVRHVHHRLWSEKKVALAAAQNGCSYMDAQGHDHCSRARPTTCVHPCFLDDKEVMLAAVVCNGIALRDAATDMCDGAHVFVDGERPAVIAHASQPGHYDLYFEDDDSWLQDVAASRLTWNPLNANKEVVLAAVMQNGQALRYADSTLQADKGLVLASLGCGLWSTKNHHLHRRRFREAIFVLMLVAHRQPAGGSALPDEVWLKLFSFFRHRDWPALQAPGAFGGFGLSHVRVGPEAQNVVLNVCLMDEDPPFDPKADGRQGRSARRCGSELARADVGRCHSQSGQRRRDCCSSTGRDQRLPHQ